VTRRELMQVLRFCMLIESHQSAIRDKLTGAVVDQARRACSVILRAPMIAETLAHYRILEELGRGGMGVVFRALDTRLDRVVALKILPGELVSDPIRKRRFIAEAKAASALNHPNIVTIYDIGSENGTDFLSMEYVPGITLAKAIAGGRLPIDKAISYAIQLADALATAHRAGIVHRDVKPGNIMVDAKQRIKLLDFGLAKLVEAVAESSRTQTVGGSRPALTEGQIVGTVAYMSPEQLTGGTVEATSDVFAFGIVLYQMLTARHPFGGSSSIEAAAQILKHEPTAPGELVEGIPRALDRIVFHCLRKNAEERFQSIADVARLLGDVRQEIASGNRIKGVPAESFLKQITFRNRYAVLAAGGLVLLAAAGILGWRFVAPARSNSGPVLTRLTSDAGLSMNPAVSPDGKLLAYASDRDGRGNLDIWVRQVAGGEPLQVTRDAADESEPDFSPDGTKIVYRSSREGGGVYITSSLGGSEPRMIAAGGHAPKFSPDGKWLTYYIGDMTSLTRRPMRSSLFLLDLSSGQTRQVEPQLPAAFHAIWSPDSKHILFSGSDAGDNRAPTDLYVAPVGDGKATPTGAVKVFENQHLTEVTPCVWSGANEIILAANLGGSRNLWQLTLADRTWKAMRPANRLTAGTGLESEASLASVRPSMRVVFSVLSSRVNLWSLPLDGSGVMSSDDLTRITDDEAAAGFPDVTADGNFLIFSSDRSGIPELWTKDLRTGKETLLVSEATAAISPAIAPDGSKFAYITEPTSVSEPPSMFVSTIGSPKGRMASRRKSSKALASRTVGLMMEDGYLMRPRRRGGVLKASTRLSDASM
jgi:eukaryotic-like serine/threonine-protein kinase